MLRRIVTSLLLLVVSNLVVSLVAQPIRIKIDYPLNETIKYRNLTRFSITGDHLPSSPLQLAMGAEISFKCIKKYENGTSDLLFRFENTFSQANKEKTSHPFEKLKGVPIIFRVNDADSLLQITPAEEVSSKTMKLIENFKQAASSNSGIGNFIPDRLVDIGDQWTSEDLIVDENEYSKREIKLKIIFKFVAYEQVDGVKCAVISESFDIKGTVDVKDESIPIQGSGYGEVFFDVAAGRIVKTINTINSKYTVPTRKGPKEAKETVTLERVLVK
jgi:hypothetical protein